MHVPVLLHETIAQLHLKPGDVAVDGTLGLGGHSAELIKAIAPEGRLISVDLDPTRRERVEQELEHDASRLGVRVDTYHASYAQLPEILADNGIQADGVVLDLGFASDQLEPERGFSFKQNGPLTMTYDPTSPSLLDRLQRADEQELGRVIREYGEERYWKRVARSIMLRVRDNQLATTMDLKEAITSVMPRAQAHGGIDPATRTFQALRIWVNGEMDHLQSFLTTMPSMMAPGGRVVIISFHSLEDSIVAKAFKELHKEGAGKMSPKFISAGLDEVVANPRSRSARLRTFTFN